MIKHKFKRTGNEWVFDGLLIRLLSNGNRPEIGVERVANEHLQALADRKPKSSRSSDKPPEIFRLRAKKKLR